MKGQDPSHYEICVYVSKTVQHLSESHFRIGREM